jgi:hypothetical protein
VREDLTLESVTERDVDLLLVEDLKCSEGFRGWFLSHLAMALGREPWQGLSSFRVRHSVSGVGKHAGETDVEVSFAVAGVRVLVLVENKIDATFQPDQAQRYALRAREHVEQHKYDEALTLLLAPSGYLGSTSTCEEFDAAMSYEDVMKYLKEQATGDGELALRYGHRLEMLKQAVERWRRGYTAVPDSTLTKLWADYYELAQTTAACLKMPRPGPKPANSTWPSFAKALEQKPGLPRVELVHKWPDARVDIHLYGMAKHYDVVAVSVAPLLGTEMRLRKAGKSLAVSIEVPRINVGQPLASQHEAAAEGLAAALRLQQWFRQNSAELQARIGPVLGHSRSEMR